MLNWVEALNPLFIMFHVSKFVEHVSYITIFHFIYSFWYGHVLNNLAQQTCSHLMLGLFNNSAVIMVELSYTYATSSYLFRIYTIACKFWQIYPWQLYLWFWVILVIVFHWLLCSLIILFLFLSEVMHKSQSHIFWSLCSHLIFSSYFLLHRPWLSVSIYLMK